MNSDTLKFKPTLQRSWLVQRLNKALRSVEQTVQINKLSFGGGLENGGFSEQEMFMLSEIFSFDYMGSAEFEFGIVPSCFQFLAKNHNDLVAGSVTVEEGKPVVYYLCHKDHAPEVPDRIKLFATNPPMSKEHIGLDQYFKGATPKEWAPKGWLDCSNGYLFFIDKGMWEATCKIFGVRI